MSGEIFIETDTAGSFGLPVSEHLYLVFRNTNSEEYVLRSGPPSGFWPIGEMNVEVNVPMGDSADDRDGDTPEARSSTPLDFSGITDDRAWAHMVKYARRIDDAEYRYDVLEENSNAFIGALLHAAGAQPGEMLPTGVRSRNAVGFSSWDNIVDDVAPPDDLIFRGSGGNDLMAGLQIDEELWAGAGNDVVNAGRGNDIVRAGLGNDTLNGQSCDDRLFGESGADTLRGSDGNDTLNGGFGNDLLIGGSGSDRAVFSGSVAALLNLERSEIRNTGHGWDTVHGIEHLTSGSGNDRLIGNGAGNILAAEAGHDVLSGGSDVLNGGSGNDRLVGGAGADQFVFANHADDEIDTVADFQPGIDRLQFSGVSHLGDLRLSKGTRGGIYPVPGATSGVRSDHGQQLRKQHWWDVEHQTGMISRGCC